MAILGAITGRPEVSGDEAQLDRTVTALRAGRWAGSTTPKGPDRRPVAVAVLVVLTAIVLAAVWWMRRGG